jgi:hypothetical protein
MAAPHPGRGVAVGKATEKTRSGGRWMGEFLDGRAAIVTCPRVLQRHRKRRRPKRSGSCSQLLRSEGVARAADQSTRGTRCVSPLARNGAHQRPDVRRNGRPLRTLLGARVNRQCESTEFLVDPEWLDFELKSGWSRCRCARFADLRSQLSIEISQKGSVQLYERNVTVSAI